MSTQLHNDTALVEQVTALFNAVADPTRVRIILLVFDTEQRSSAIAEALDMTPSAISHQLRWLRDRRIVTSRKQGRETYYQLADDCIRELVRMALHHVREEEA